VQLTSKRHIELAGDANFKDILVGELEAYLGDSRRHVSLISKVRSEGSRQRKKQRYGHMYFRRSGMSGFHGVPNRWCR